MSELSALTKWLLAPHAHPLPPASLRSALRAAPSTSPQHAPERQLGAWGGIERDELLVRYIDGLQQQQGAGSALSLRPAQLTTLQASARDRLSPDPISYPNPNPNPSPGPSP